MTDFKPGDRVRSNFNRNGEEFTVAAVDGPDIWIKSDAGWRFTQAASSYHKVAPKWKLGKKYVHNIDPDGVIYKVVYVFDNDDAIFIWNRRDSGLEEHARVKAQNITIHTEVTE